MSEYIKREDAIDAVCGWGQNDLTEAILADIETLPAVEVVEVVRCKDCKWTKTDGMDDPAIYCEKWDRWEMPPDGFCSVGRKRGTA